jgi:hypothetical protein
MVYAFLIAGWAGKASAVNYTVNHHYTSGGAAGQEIILAKSEIW